MPDPLHPLVVRVSAFRPQQDSDPPVAIPASDRTGTEASLRIVQALTLAKSTADAERRVFEAGLATAQTRTISDISSAIAESAEAALTRRVRVFDRNTTPIAVAVLFTMTGVCLTGGYWWGSSNALAGVQQTEAGLRAAFTNSPADAATWVKLMEWNGIRSGLDQCSKSGVSFVQDRREACQVPLWIESPKPFGAALI